MSYLKKHIVLAIIILIILFMTVQALYMISKGKKVEQPNNNIIINEVIN